MGLSGVQRTVKFVKYLPEHGWKPFVLTVTPDNFYAFDDGLLDNFEGRNVQIYRTRLKSNQQRKTKQLPPYFVQKTGRFVLNLIYQPDSKIKWMTPAMDLADLIIKRNNINVIVATAPPFTDFVIAMELSKKHEKKFEFQMLKGIRDELKPILVKSGFQVSEYIPYGTNWLPYSIRRLKERKRNILLLGSSFSKFCLPLNSGPMVSPS